MLRGSLSIFIAHGHFVHILRYSFPLSRTNVGYLSISYVPQERRYLLSLKEKLIEELTINELFQIGPFTITETIVNTWIVMGIVLVACILLTRNLKVENPGKRQLAVESAVTWLQNTANNMLGEGAQQYAGYIITVLIFIGTANLAAIFETKITSDYTIFKPPTKDLNVTIALALMSIILVEYSGIRKKHLGGWLKSFAKPVAIVAPLNVLEVFIKPLSLCMRLFGNIFGAFIIMELIKCLVPAALPVPLSFYFDIFDGIMQAYVFVFLTAIYIQEATE